MPKEKVVVVACATSLGTSGNYAEVIKKFANQEKVAVKVVQISLSGRQIEDYIKRYGKPHFILGSPAWGIKQRLTRSGADDIPVVDGIALLTGVGKEKVEEKIVELLRSED